MHKSGQGKKLPPIVNRVSQEILKAQRQLIRLLHRQDSSFAVRQRIALLNKRLASYGINVNAPKLAGLRKLAGAAAFSAATFLPNVQAQASGLTFTADPKSDSIGVARDANICLTFSEKMSTNSFTTVPTPSGANLTVWGSQTGIISTAATVTLEDSAKKLRIDPLDDFFPGELISLTVTGATTAQGQVMPFPIGYSFRAAVAPSQGKFEESVKLTDFDDGNLIEMGDMDGDGDLDIVTIYAYDDLAVLRNDGNNNFTENYRSFSRAGALELGDFDNDGDLDVVVNALNGILRTFMNNGDATFTNSSTLMPHNRFLGMATGDLDADGDLDVVISSSEPAKPPQILVNNGDGTFAFNSLPAIRSSDCVIGDFDGDSDMDIFMPSNVSSQQSKFLKNDGKGNFTISDVPIKKYNRAEAGDMDGDGDLDIVLNSGNALLDGALLTNDGSGNFSLQSIGTKGRHRDLDVADLNGDGALDVIISLAEVSVFNTPGGVEVLLNSGTGTFTSHLYGNPDDFTQSLGFGDLDGDNDIDLVVGNEDLNLKILENVVPPSVTSMYPICLETSLDSIPLCFIGDGLSSVTGASLTLPGSNILFASGASVSLSVNSLTATKLNTQIPAGNGTQFGRYAITLYNSDGQSSFEFDINPNVELTGPECVYPGQVARYTLQPEGLELMVNDSRTGARAISNAVLGRRVSIREHEVEFIPDSIGSILYRKIIWRNKCRSQTDTIFVQTNSRRGVDDQSQVSPGSTTMIDVLANDPGAELQLTRIDQPESGSAYISNNQISFTAAEDSSATCVIFYEAKDSNDCAIAAQLVVTIGNAKPETELAFIQRRKDRKQGVRGLRRVEDVVVSPNGKHVYATGRSDHSLVLFNRDSSDGTIDYVKRWREGKGGIRGLRFASNIAISPTGDHLYVSAYGGKSITVFDRNENTGDLTRRHTKTLAGGALPRGVAVSPDDNFVYVAAGNTSTVAVYQRGSGDSLAFVQQVRDGQGGINGLRGANDLTISPDGQHLYVTGPGDDAVAIFKRNLSNGSLSFVGLVRDNVNGVDGLNGASAVKVRKDGKFIYVAGNQDDAVAVFSRNAATGALRFVQVIKNRGAGISGLDGVTDVAISPDRMAVYAVSQSENALVDFQAEDSTGRIIFNSVKRDGRDGVDGLRGAKAVDVSSDSKFVYVAGSSDNAVAVFRRRLKPLAKDDRFVSFVGTSPFGGLNVEFLSVLENDFDFEGEGLTIVAVTSPAVGSVLISANDKKVKFTKPTFSEAELDTLTPGWTTNFTYTVENQSGARATASVVVQLTPEAEVSDSLDKQQLRQQLPVEAMPQFTLLESLTAAPNPTDGLSTIGYQLNGDAAVDIAVYDLTGRKITSLVNTHLSSGEYRVNWNGSEHNDQVLQSGSYYVVIKADNGQQSETQSIALKLVH